LTLTDPEEFEKDSRMFGATDQTATATYHFRPFGRPQIEAYFGGRLARELEAGGEHAFFDFALSQLTGLLGSAFRDRVKPIRIHRWSSDRYSRGSYSYARPGMADCRMKLAAPVDDRLFFAGEACSQHDFSTAHGAGSQASPRPNRPSQRALGREIGRRFVPLDQFLSLEAAPASVSAISSPDKMAKHFLKRFRPVVHCTGARQIGKSFFLCRIGLLDIVGHSK
jgi:hypothetical protein